jgi:hypothetical protein
MRDDRFGRLMGLEELAEMNRVALVAVVPILEMGAVGASLVGEMVDPRLLIRGTFLAARAYWHADVVCEFQRWRISVPEIGRTCRDTFE